MTVGAWPPFAWGSPFWAAFCPILHVDETLDDSGFFLALQRRLFSAVVYHSAEFDAQFAVLVFYIRAYLRQFVAACSIYFALTSFVLVIALPILLPALGSVRGRP